MCAYTFLFYKKKSNFAHRKHYLQRKITLRTQKIYIKIKQVNTLKKLIPDALVILLFAVISFAYFYPADIEGRILYRHDSSAGRGLGEEAREFKEQTGEITRWTNSAFSGMPTYQSSPSYSSANSLTQVMDAYHLWLPENVWYVFAYLLGFYILLRAFDFRWYLATLGAIVWAFSSYFLIIIAAGHIWKVIALAYLPPMLAGILLAYKGKYIPGFIPYLRQEATKSATLSVMATSRPRRKRSGLPPSP